ncbi:hypothetical protein [Parazoarcus communis]|uniref:Uncharacterized protein n=1 Tax=Parazoarcus communis SWub3 = DSM 12120 TaxID=1121029 RepID=A0A323UTR0_9RHOO|nr:hypothetical protein [Parazoarcus communis]NMG71299.1 hypothetical protein [Parazoarcus communis SWub3 = DSM 12120]PZA15060.1 hypothetical protein DNK49_18860 [Azoarcus communis] [Parazoarcus communis SWub3 = DSM 12120]
MSLAKTEARTVRLQRTLCCGLALVVLVGCSALFDAPSYENVAASEMGQILGDVVREQAAEMARQGSERVSRTAEDGMVELQRVIVFPYPDGTTGERSRNWPVMRVDKIGQRLPQLVLESPMRGLVFLNDREIGLVQDDSVRIITLDVGEHHIRIERPPKVPMVAQFYADRGERIILRWESR